MFWLLLLLVPTPLQPVQPGLAAAQTSNPISLGAQIDAILGRQAFRNATVGVTVRHLPSNDVVYERDAHRSLVPASNQKLATAAVALANLGRGFHYTTSVLGAGDIDDEGTLHGDIFLRGSGDPTVSRARLAQLAQAARETGLRRVTGRVVGDGSALDDEVLGPGWQWDDEPWYYAAQVSGLNCDANVVHVEVEAGDVAGDPVRATVNSLPATDEEYVTLRNSVKTVDEPAYAYFSRLRGRNIIPITGAIQVTTGSVAQDVTVENPTLFSASRFSLALLDAGIALDSPLAYGEGPTPVNASELTTSTSAALSVMLPQFLKPSDNLFGEAFLKTVGRDAAPAEPGSTYTGVAALQAFLDQAGIATAGVSAFDGSGLSTRNTVTANFIADLLVHIDDAFSDQDRALYLDALPVGGVDGTLEDRFVDSPLTGRLRAKTGSLTGVSSLSGFLSAHDDQRYAFAIIMNHAASSEEARRGQDDIATALYHHHRSQHHG